MLTKSTFRFALFSLIFSFASHAQAAFLDGSPCDCNRATAGLCDASAIPLPLEKLIDLHRTKVLAMKKNSIVEIPMEFVDKPLGRDLYNSPGEVTALYQDEPTTFFVGREESPTSETDMKVAFYQKNAAGQYVYLNGKTGIPNLSLQDPFMNEIVTENGKELILGGVKVWHYVDEEGREGLNYATVFYRDHGKGIEHLEEFLTGPDRMKDVRFVQNPDHTKITIFTRPQNGNPDLGGRGKVGMFHVDKLEDITAAKIKDAPIFRNQFQDDEWGGVNASTYLDSDRIGVLGHYARFDAAGNRDYVAVSWIVNTKDNTLSDVKVVVERKDLPGGVTRGAKRDDLKNVMFPSGFRRNSDGTMDIWGGEGDQSSFQVRIRDPFLN